ncbi:MAG: glycoside hydrolase family 3 C-terminal domain-containing protein [Solobacterium sp.]|nr:glycoside hydrolase family 3 C-terminal domain-containing protein [Solobacterium sp.]
MRKLLILFLAALLVTGCGKPKEAEGTPAEETPQETAADPDRTRAEGLLEGMDNRAKLEQLLVLSIQTFNGQPFTSMNEEVAPFFDSHAFGGFILFDSNIGSISEAAVLTDDLQRHTLTDNAVPMLIAIDQEGGSLTRLKYGTVTPGNMALGASGNASLAKASASILGKELSAVGINTDFAPDADINNQPANPVIGLRSFSDDPALTAEMVGAFIQGLDEAGTVSCAKHFPGHGNTTTDSHTGLPVVNSTKEELETMELVPFHQAVDQNVDMIMSAHICFPEIEKDTYISKLDGSEITLPSTLSDDLIQGILRQELGYDGVVITDSLLMDAVNAHFDPIDAAVLAFNAGVDMLLMPVRIEDANGFEAVDQYLNALKEKIGSEIPQERLDEAVTRVLTMKSRNGILELTPAEDIEARRQTAEETVGRMENHESERAIADQCVTLLRNENDLLPFTGAGTIVFAAPQSSQMNAMQKGMEQLLGQIDLIAYPTYINYRYGQNVNELLNAVPGASLVVISSWLDNMSQFDPSESIMIPSVQQVIDACHAAGVPVVVISSGLPYDLSCYDNADALLAVYNPKGLPEDDNGNPTDSCSPNLPAAVDIIFGYAKPSAVLPVNVPKVEGTGFTDEIAYPRGSGLTIQ